MIVLQRRPLHKNRDAGTWNYWHHRYTHLGKKRAMVYLVHCNSLQLNSFVPLYQLLISRGWSFLKSNFLLLVPPQLDDKENLPVNNFHRLDTTVISCTDLFQYIALLRYQFEVACSKSMVIQEGHWSITIRRLVNRKYLPQLIYVIYVIVMICIFPLKSFFILMQLK